MDSELSTFLVPVNETEDSRASLALGYQMAATLGATLGIVLLDSLSTESVERSRDAHAARFGQAPNVDTYVLHGQPDESFLDWIAALKQPIVVLRTDSDTDGTLHDITHWILQRAGATITTLVGRGHSRTLNLRRLLVPLDGSPAAEQILPLATQFALNGNATLGMVRVVPSVDRQLPPTKEESRIEQERDEARAYLDRVARSLRQRGVQTSWEVRIGAAGSEIARAAQTTATDLILIASQHYSGQSETSALSVADAAIRAADVPVIVARVHTRTVDLT